MEPSSVLPEDQYQNFNSSDFSNKAASLNPQIKVKSIEFSGIKRTDQKFLLNALEKTGLEESVDLLQLSKALNESFVRLERLNIFKDVSVTIDQAEGSEDATLSEMPVVHSVKILFKCKEKRFNIRTGTELQRKDIAWNFGGQFFNLFGRAESLEVNSSIGANSSMPFNLNFLKPLNGDPNRNFFINSVNFKENFLNHCKWRQEIQSFSTGLQLTKDLSRHEFKYLLELRKLFNVQSGASHVIRNQAGKTIKSSIIHTWNLSNRDNSAFPTCGSLLRINNELAGIGGDTRFFKTEMILQNNWTKNIFTLTKTLKLGLVVSGDLNNTSVSLFDRFQMGGPTSIRGFPVNSLGPRQFYDSIGGTSLIETGLQLSFPIVKSAANFARAHIFANAGLLSDKFNIFGPKKSITLKEDLNPNVSVGGGLMFKMNESVRLELNFSVPILTQKGVESNRGLQVGIGMEFL